MRSEDHQQSAMFSYLSPEQRVPANHPLRKLRALVETVLTRLGPSFTTMYSRSGRPSIAPEKLLRALLLQFLYSIRSERLLMEELDYNLLFRWFVGLNMDDPVWDATVYAKNRERLLKHEVAEAFFQQVAQLAGERDLLSDEHFTVDGTLIEAWAGIQSFKKKEDSTQRKVHVCQTLCTSDVGETDRAGWQAGPDGGCCPHCQGAECLSRNLGRDEFHVPIVQPANRALLRCSKRTVRYCVLTAATIRIWTILLWKQQRTHCE